MLKRIMLFICVIISLGFTQAGYAQEKITWPYISHYPVFISENNELTGGIGLLIYKILWTNMPSYEHSTVFMPIKRLVDDMKNGEHYLFYGLYKTPDREAIMYYSIPCRISPPSMIVIRKEDLKEFGGGDPVSLRVLLKDKKHRFLRFASISLGNEIDTIIKEYENEDHVYTEHRTDDMITTPLDLLLQKRVDYFPSLNGTIFRAKETGAIDKIALLPIKERMHYEVGYITAPKNEWGKMMIEKIDSILRKEIPTDSFFGAFKVLVPDEKLPELRKEFEELILKPAIQ